MEISAQTVVIAVVAGLVLLHLAGFFPTKRRTGNQRSSRYVASRFSGIGSLGAFDAGQQLGAVMASSFAKQRLMNSSEYKLFRTIEEELVATGAGLRVFAQTSLGEVLKSDDDAAFRAINSKRVDILVIDRAGWPVLAVEFQGAGHYQGAAAARDAVKKEALRRAGVPYLEVTTNDSDDYVRDRLRALLGLAGPAEAVRRRQPSAMRAIG